MIIEMKHVCKSYGKPGFFSAPQHIPVLHDIHFSIPEGQSIGLVGESGSGKSTLGRLLLGLERPDSGEVLVDRSPVARWMNAHRGDISVVFQNYSSSANPRLKIHETLAEPFIAHQKERVTADQLEALLHKVDLAPSILERYPHQLSGGQLQRVCIARAIAIHPKFLVLDEAISSLDVSIQAQIVRVLERLKADMNLSYFFISHDIGAVARLCDRLLFLSRGKLVEDVEKERLAHVSHPYARQLLQAASRFHLATG